MRYLLALLLLAAPVQAQTITTRNDVRIDGRLYRQTVTLEPLEPSNRPTPPANLSAPTISSARIDLAWTDTATNETGYALWRRQGTGEWSRIALLGPGTTRYSDWGVTAGASYTYRAQTVTELGASDYSNEVAVTAQSQNPPPGTVEPFVTGAVWASEGPLPVTGERVAVFGQAFGPPGKLQINFGDVAPLLWEETKIEFAMPHIGPPPPPVVSVRRVDGQWYSGPLVKGP